MEILYLGGFKQTVYFDTGRLQGYPLCEIDFFHFLIGSSIRDWSIEMWEVLPQKLVTPKKWLPQKIDKTNGYPKKTCYPQKYKKKWLPQKIWRTLLRGGLLLHFGKMAYFIAYGFINAIQTLHIYIYILWLGIWSSYIPNHIFLCSSCATLTFITNWLSKFSMSIREETVDRRCTVKKVFLEISQNSLENTCARDSILIKLQA